MARKTQHRQVGDRRTAIAAQLVRPDGTAVDVTGLTVKFKMVDSQGTAVVAETTDNVTVNDATNGKVYYAPAAADVDTAGTFHAYFVVYDGTLGESFPVEAGHFRVQIHDTA